MEQKSGCTFHDARAVRRAAFTRTELLASLAALASIVVVAVPVLAAPRARSEVVQCLNNVRQIGRAVQVWDTEYSDDPPWVTRVSDGGTVPNSGSKIANAWYEFAFLSNQLTTPRTLACPADDKVKVASDFSNDPERGYLAPTFRSAATSYSINLHAMARLPGTMLCADLNLRFRASPSSCFYAQNPYSFFVPFAPGERLWTNAVHGPIGNVVLVDGTVMETTSAQLQPILTLSAINGILDFIKAR